METPNTTQPQTATPQPAQPQPAQPQPASTTLQGFEEKIAAQIRAANVRIDQFEVESKPKRAQAEVAAINGLKVARQNIERMLVDLKKTRDEQLQTAKADIDAAVVSLQWSLEEFRKKFTSASAKK